MIFEIRAMSVSEILDTGFALVRSRLRDLAGIGFIVYLPFAVLSLVLAAIVGPEAERLAVVDPEQMADALPVLLLMGSASLLAYALGFPLIVAAVTALVGGVYLGRQVTLGGAMRTGLERFLPLLGTFLLFGLSALVVAAAVGVSIGLLIGAAASWLGGAAATLVGFLGLLVMGVLYTYVTSAYAVILQVVIFEQLWAWRAILRALELTHGMRLRTLTVVFVMTLVVFFPIVIVQIFFGDIPVIGLAAVSALQALGFAYTSCTEVVLYFDLRCRKEAFDLEYLAQLVEAA